MLNVLQISWNDPKELWSQFSKLGMTMEETAEYTADYLELQTRLGRSQRMTDAQLSSRCCKHCDGD